MLMASNIRCPLEEVQLLICINDVLTSMLMLMAHSSPYGKGFPQEEWMNLLQLGLNPLPVK